MFDLNRKVFAFDFFSHRPQANTFLYRPHIWLISNEYCHFWIMSMERCEQCSKTLFNHLRLTESQKHKDSILSCRTILPRIVNHNKSYHSIGYQTYCTLFPLLLWRIGMPIQEGKYQSWSSQWSDRCAQDSNDLCPSVYNRPGVCCCLCNTQGARSQQNNCTSLELDGKIGVKTDVLNCIYTTKIRRTSI